jgi:acyl-CoA reductase-like NAD-dependent aldehyde dehydrogenase
MEKFEYAPAPESAALVDIKSEYGLFINGKFVAPKSGKTFKTVNPATEEVLAKIAYAELADVNLAVTAARNAFTKTWSKMPAAERGKYLFRIARILQERSREFAVLETLDNGKPIRETRDTDIPLAAAHFFYHAGWADKLSYAGVGSNPKPYGVAAQIIPWNFPMLMLAWKIAPALATGNTVVLKPAETTPLTALLFAEVCQQAGLPAGVVNIITGDGATGSHLVNHPGVDKVAFTGSTSVGKAIAKAIAGTKKSATLELGGKGLAQRHDAEHRRIFRLAALNGGDGRLLDRRGRRLHHRRRAAGRWRPDGDDGYPPDLTFRPRCAASCPPSPSPCSSPG